MGAYTLRTFLLALLVFVQHSQAASLPEWVKMKEDRPYRIRELATNKRVVKQANRSRRRFDLVMYGDSLVAFHQHNPKVWRSEFGGSGATAALGVGGTTVEELAWRIMSGNELPARPPRVVALFIGLNNVKYKGGLPEDRVDFHVRWLQKRMPKTRFVVMALVPNADVDVKPANAALRRVAARRGATFLACGQRMDPKDPSFFEDGTHMTARAQRVVLRCLKRQVGPWLSGKA